MSGLSWRTTVTVVLLIATMIAIASAAVVISRPSDPLRAADAKIGSVAAEGSPASVTIVAGDSAAVIARRLLASQVIESDTRFELLALLFGWESRLEPGSYTFEAGLTTYEILRRIHFGEISPLRLVIPEGLRLEQVTERLAQAGVIDRAELAAALATAAESTVAGTLAARRPPRTSLEGYLFPSAYSFPLGSTPEDALRFMLLRFDDMMTPQLWEQITASGRSLHEILTIASIIEREVVQDSERSLVSAVIWNRLEAGMLLQMNSTVQYAVGEPSGWWKAELSDDDLSLASPYNTYLSSGLPPTPIASPGLASIEAAANPANVPYLFFVARGDGTHAFAVTYEEHQANVERYRGGSQ
ncbi:MAG: endolytic transglycosylase MltG [Chloroflexi bacterium]|nr:endolytic transglycosylase MltG [Chloroflexota bacterium]MYJ92338.1 endolytic transglycosylase MltG [Chloroflexota bacterium]